MVVTHGTRLPGAGRQALTVGNFDGVHLGHRAMLERVIAQARGLGLASCVLTFEPHAREFFSPATAPARLTRLRDKLELFAAAGIDRVHVARFDARLAGVAAERFVDEVLLRGLGAAWLLVGRDFRFGAKRAGDFALLERMARERGFALEAMPDVTLDAVRVSSSAVRAALAAGELARAARLLGRRFTLSGRVAHGERLGRALGFPTANIVLRRRPPLAGVFVVEAELEETQARLRGAASVGRRPTVRDNALPLLEVHLLDFEAPIYGKHLRVTFLEKLRDEEKYDGLDALRAAIARDVERTREYFRNHG
ncbi:MAG: bifunctional riboflavin kinase/FAD synthetase [Betaproteobacteria bacterium]|nr:MAG: bifunctional riboflavin kinase/FAD synthetase [Betaproteobacteria bacterium]